MTDPADRIALRGVRAWGRHGVFEAERASGQPFVVDAVLELDTRTAARSDDLADTVDYGALAGTLAKVVCGESVQLLETLAGRLAEVCLEDPRVSAVQITVHKPEAPVAVALEDVSVTIHRRR